MARVEVDPRLRHPGDFTRDRRPGVATLLPRSRTPFEDSSYTLGKPPAISAEAELQSNAPPENLLELQHIPNLDIVVLRDQRVVIRGGLDGSYIVVEFGPAGHLNRIMDVSHFPDTDDYKSNRHLRFDLGADVLGRIRDRSKRLHTVSAVGAKVEILGDTLAQRYQSRTRIPRSVTACMNAWSDHPSMVFFFAHQTLVEIPDHIRPDTIKELSNSGDRRLEDLSSPRMIQGAPHPLDLTSMEANARDTLAQLRFRIHRMTQDMVAQS